MYPRDKTKGIYPSTKSSDPRRGRQRNRPKVSETIRELAERSAYMACF